MAMPRCVKSLDSMELHRYNARMNASFALISLGCAKNQVDSEHMVGCMVEAGFRQVEPGEADVLIINTCGFIDPAKEEAINTISRELKALEIINNKGINIWELRYSYSVNEYNICKGDTNKSLTQEEYDLLKEVLL
jgi:hypothetical protein